MIASGTLWLCFDARIVAEYAQVLGRPKFPFRQDHIRTLLEQIKAAGLVVASNPLPSSLPDPADEPFLEAALTGHAQCLITGNLKHFPPSLRQGMRVLTPGDFLEFYRQSVLTGKKRP